MITYRVYYGKFQCEALDNARAARTFARAMAGRTVIYRRHAVFAIYVDGKEIKATHGQPDPALAAAAAFTRALNGFIS